MKKTNLLWLAAVLALVAALVGCQQDSGSNSGGSSVSLPAAISPASIQNFAGTAVADKDEALALLQVLGDHGDDNFLDVLISARLAALEDAIGVDFSDFFGDYTDKKSFSISVPINDSTALKDGANAVTPDSVTAATIKGSLKGSYNGNITLGDYMDRDYEWVPGNTVSNSSSGTITYNISEGSYQKTVGTAYQISGIITVQLETGERTTFVSPESATADEKSTGSKVMTGKITAALSISNGTKGGKFVCSSAIEYSNTSRTAVDRMEEIVSDIEVYNNTNTKIITLDSRDNGLGDLIPYLGLAIGGGL